MTISAQQLALTTDLAGSGTGLRNLQIATDLTKTFSGADVQFTAGELSITGTPANANDAVNKAYVDNISAGLDPKESVRVATTAALQDSPTYDNGTSGVGATLTGAGNEGINTSGIDGNTSLIVGDRILVKDQAAALQNGIYEVTTLGSAAVAASGTLTSSSSVTTDGETVELGGVYYVFKNVGNGTGDGSVGNPYQVDIQGGAQGNLQELADEVNGVGSNGNAAHPTISAGAASGTISLATVVFTADTAGTAGNSLSTTETGANLSFGAATLEGGADGVAYVLTRSTDFDGSPANEVSGGAHTFVEAGTTNQGTGWNVIFDGNITVGTDAVNWSQFSSSGAFSGGDGIDITGSVISAVVSDFAGAGLEDDGSNNLRIAAAAAGNGLTGGGGSALAVLASPGGSLTVDGTGVDVSDGGIGSDELADNGVTPAKTSYVPALATVAAASFSYDGTRSNVTLANAALADVELQAGYVTLRNGVDELTKVAAPTAGAEQWSVSGTTWSIHGDITGSGDVYRLRYMIANT